MATPEVVVALTTFGDEASAERVVQALVEARLIACGTLLSGARSIYRWEGKVERASEVVVLLKTTAERVEALVAALPGLHPYELPELVVLPVTAGLPGYLKWVAGEVGFNG
jgi:periplasmic divalent cation tolerance protein